MPSSTGQTSGTSNTVNVPVNYANVTVVKSIDASTPGPFQVGSTLTYDVTATNSATSTSATNVSLSDVLPAGVSLRLELLLVRLHADEHRRHGHLHGERAGHRRDRHPQDHRHDHRRGRRAELGDLDPVRAVVDGSTSGTSNTVTPTVNYANVTVVKSIDASTPGPFQVGSTLTYDVTATNSATSTSATNVSLSDVLPAGVSYVSSSSSACTPTNTAGTVTCTVASLAPGASATLQITVTITAGVVGPNSATWTQSVPSSTGQTSGTSNTVNVPVNYANVTVVKSIDASTPGPYEVGSTLTYDVAATNSAGRPRPLRSRCPTCCPPGSPSPRPRSPRPGPARRRTPPAPSPATTSPSPSAGRATLKITVTITAGVVGPNSATWTQSVPSSTGQTSGTSNTVNVPVNYANVTVVKSIDASTPGPFQVGSTLTYDVVAHNAAGSTSATGVTLSDVLPAGVSYVSSSSSACTPTNTAGTVTCTVASLAPGASATLQITVTITAGVVGPNSATWTQSVPSSTGQTSGTSNTVTPTVNYANVTVVKSIDASTPGPYEVGSTLTYDVTATNSATSTSATNVSLSDVLPAGVAFSSATVTPAGACTPTNTAGTVTCTVASLAPGASATLQITVTITAGVVGPNSATWTQSVPSSTGQTSGTSNTVNVPVGYANVTVVKSIDASTPGPYEVGSTLTYDVTASSDAGSTSATDVTLSDVLPAGVSYVSSSSSACTPTNTAGTVTCTVSGLAIGATATLKITVTITAGVVGPNSATWTQSVPSSTGQTSGTSNTVNVPVNYANVTVVKSIDASTPGPFQVGSTLTYDVTATNSATSTSATDVSLSDVLPAGVSYVSSSSSACTPTNTAGTVTCTVASLAIGASATLQITVTITAGVVGPNSATWTQSVPSSTGQTSGTSNTVNVPVNYANVTVVKSIDASTPGPFQVGSTLTYDVTATNSATSTSATDVSLSDVLPAGVSYVSSSSSACTPTNTAGTVTCTVGALAIGATATLQITVTITAGVVGPNSATWTQSVPSSTGQTSGTSNTVNVHGQLRQRHGREVDRRLDAGSVPGRLDPHL